MRRTVIVAVALVTALTGAGAGQTATPPIRPEAFDIARARAHIERLAGTVGRRPTGSPANARAGAYLVEQLTSLGFAVRVQEADAVDARNGVTARVANVIGLRAGRREEAIALAAHYDSIPDGPGALDNALGVATVLESARVLTAAGGLTHGLIVVFTDGEEFGLMGARALVQDDEIRRRVRAWINFDGTGADDPR